MNGIGRFFAFVITLLAAVGASSAGEPRSESPGVDSTASIDLNSSPPGTTIWQDGVGQGFRSSVHTISVEAGAAVGFAAFGSRQAHDLALVSLSYGHMLGEVVGEDHWFRGNFEWRAEFFTGAQFAPSSEWLVGLTPHLRYNFATGTRWIPFLDGGAGVTATGIGPPDLSNTFEFNLQAGAGVHRFWRDDVSLTLEARYMHMSCAGLSQPNLGLNSVIGMVGLTWFF
ncbi:MAG TPA: acyloxyacyl hydrolase [Candidatus Acidoferrum sp.]|jgi:lipid A 3-O-deacylase|nr:acyloxyacyl hydrolase [Candidatus Acidoferrum sp.]